MLKVLIVDDEEEILESIFRFLSVKLPQYEYTRTSSSRQAREILKTDLVDILLTDIKMPHWDGFELSSIAKETNPDCHVIFLTGYQDFDFAYQAIKSKCDDFILKNDLNDEVIRSIQRTALSLEKKRAEERMSVPDAPLPDAQYHHSIDFVQQYIREHIDSDISLNKLAQAVYLSPAYLSRLFKNVTGLNITEYLLQVRIKTAKNLLVTSEKQVQDVALAVGIDSPVYFTRLFKKATGFTPVEYRSLFYGKSALKNGNGTVKNFGKTD